jgi:hypothetical protein
MRAVLSLAPDKGILAVNNLQKRGIKHLKQVAVKIILGCV